MLISELTFDPKMLGELRFSLSIFVSLFMYLAVKNTGCVWKQDGYELV